MALKYKYSKDKEADIPKDQKALYIERNGFFFLDVDDVVETETLAEFRNNNREMMRLLGTSKIEDAIARLQKLKDIDPEKYQQLQDELKAFTDGKAPKLDELLATRTDAMKKDYEKKLSDAGKSNETMLSRLTRHLIDDSLATTAAKKGVLAAAIEDVKLRGRSVFKLEGEEVVATGPDGKVLYGKDGKPLTMDEWMDKLAVDSKHLFEANRGGGSHGGGGTPTPGWDHPNPYSKKTRNLTLQAQVERDNPALAKKLQATAEV